MIPGSSNPLMMAAAPAAGGYQIERSLRFNSSDSAYCSRTPAVAGNRRTFTWAGWVKKCNNSAQQSFFSAGNSGTNRSSLLFPATGEIRFFNYAGSVNVDLVTTPVFRDPSAWYHILVAVDTTQATSTNRFKLYVNGTQFSTFSPATYPSLNQDLVINSAIAHGLGRGEQAGEYFDGYLAEVFFIDGQQLTPSSFTEVSATTGQLIPKTYTGTYGTNGFQLKFADNSSNTASTLGKDTSGNSNNWTPNNLAIWNGGGAMYSVGSLTRPGSGFTTPGYLPYLMFDGNLTTFASNDAGGGTNTWTPPLSITVTSQLRVYGASGSYPQGMTWAVNGISQGSGSSGVWLTASVSTPYTLTSISNTLGGGAAGSFFAAVEVDGVILVDKTNATNDSLVDTPTSYGTDTGVGGSVRGNYCTWNPLANTAVTLSNGNLDGLTIASNAFTRCNSTISVSSGKWYFEVLLNVAGTNTTVGIGQNQITSQYPGQDALSYVQELDNARKGNSDTFSSYGSSLVAGDVFMCAFDLNNNKIFFGKNGSWFGSSDPASGTSPAYTLSTGTYCPIARPYGNLSGSISANFGQRAFAYTAPSGFKALCDTNLGASLTAKPNTLMDVALYTGNGSTQTISGLNFSPDFVWIKQRDVTRSHQLFDIIRGANNVLFSDTTDAEQAVTGRFDSFDSTGFSLGSSDRVNGSGGSYAAWAWDAGTTTASNPDGSITSQVRANASAGFSIVTYTGNGTAGATIGHGLGVNPSFVIVKSRSGSGSSYYWICYHGSLGATKALELNSTTAAFISPGAWNNTEPTSSVFSVASNAVNNGSGSTYVAYCFSPVVGYTSAGSYTGNGSADGPFVYTSMRPRWILLKRTDSTGNWTILDTAREGYNVDNDPLFPNLADAEGTADLADILSNGFKLRSTDASVNASGGTYIYYAISETAFQYSRAR